VGDATFNSGAEDNVGYAELAIGAEVLAAISMTAAERIEHLMMAGVYHLRARQAGSLAGVAAPN
jgi:hypothetical protein